MFLHQRFQFIHRVMVVQVHPVLAAVSKSAQQAGGVRIIGFVRLFDQILVVETSSDAGDSTQLSQFLQLMKSPVDLGKAPAFTRPENGHRHVPSSITDDDLFNASEKIMNTPSGWLPCRPIPCAHCSHLSVWKCQ
ncbi:hypothetical protein CBW46_009150 [Paenibacillus xerothermodurans]|uniref:Uncharacterized protein n=1 Tax=Paenibacillus xerothermodurans TaxID=1977292 RepID=A0A2W1P2Y3_PAEXE|nr:hypothetical protein CBW46_009150 [Paenibacillus xerothermodurans]